MARFIINATFTYDEPTGLGVYTYELTKELLRQRSSDIIAYTTSRAIKKLYPSSVRLTSKLISPNLRLKGHFLRNLWQQFNLPAHVLIERGQLLYTTVPEGAINPFIDQIITFHDILPIKYPEMYPRMKYHFYYVAPLLIKTCKAIICDSENTKKDIVNYYNITDKPVFIIRPGINKELFYPREKGFINVKYGLDKFICYVGDMRPYKNLERAIEAFGRSGLKDCKFVIAGKKDRRFFPQLERIVRELKLEDRVIFLGYIPHEYLPHLYSDAAAFVFPSLYEGFGFPPLEAMACGCPVVVSNVASLPEVCGDAAYYVNPYDVWNIAEVIYKVLTDEALRRNMIRRGLERVKLFSWEKSAKEHIKVFEEIASQP